jgi:hypothetical protein
MPTHMKKPSEQIREIALARMSEGERLANWGHVTPTIADVIAYLDAEAERALPKPVICPECTASGAKSKIINVHRGGAVRDVYFEPKVVFDEDGREHHHDEIRQSYRVGYKCANGHTFGVSSITPCWCGWPEGK